MDEGSVDPDSDARGDSDASAEREGADPGSEEGRSRAEECLNDPGREEAPFGEGVDETEEIRVPGGCQKTISGWPCPAAIERAAKSYVPASMMGWVK